jgi:hypothetical protein
MKTQTQRHKDIARALPATQEKVCPEYWLKFVGKETGIPVALQ